MFEKIYGETLADKVAVQIIDAIAAEDFVSGEYLPSEHQLCHQFEISRTTVRAALMILAQKGYIQTRRGKGSMVLEQRVGNADLNYEQATQARLLLEAGAAAWAAGRLPEEALGDLEAQHKQCAMTVGNQRYEALMQFRMLLVSFCESGVLYQLERELAEICLRAHSPKSEALDRAFEIQQEILRQIKSHDAQAAYFAALAGGI